MDDLKFRPECMVIVMLTVIALASPAQAREMLVPGAYDVQIDLQRSAAENELSKTRATICVTGAEHRGLSVLSVDNPAARCPVSDVTEQGSRLTFRIVCPASSASRGSTFGRWYASASYELEPERFSGNIVMIRGGEPRMIEMQTGVRVGECRP
jgi:hypothetical protein